MKLQKIKLETDADQGSDKKQVANISSSYVKLLNSITELVMSNQVQQLDKGLRALQADDSNQHDQVTSSIKSLQRLKQLRETIKDIKTNGITEKNLGRLFGLLGLSNKLDSRSFYQHIDSYGNSEISRSVVQALIAIKEGYKSRLMIQQELDSSSEGEEYKQAMIEALKNCSGEQYKKMTQCLEAIGFLMDSSFSAGFEAVCAKFMYVAMIKLDDLNLFKISKGMEDMLAVIASVDKNDIGLGMLSVFDVAQAEIAAENPQLNDVDEADKKNAKEALNTRLGQVQSINSNKNYHDILKRFGALVAMFAMKIPGVSKLKTKEANEFCLIAHYILNGMFGYYNAVGDMKTICKNAICLPLMKGMYAGVVESAGSLVLQDKEEIVLQPLQQKSGFFKSMHDAIQEDFNSALDQGLKNLEQPSRERKVFLDFVNRHSIVGPVLESIGNLDVNLAVELSFLKKITTRIAKYPFKKLSNFIRHRNESARANQQIIPEYGKIESCAIGGMKK